MTAATVKPYYYIVNPAGAVHTVTRDHATTLLATGRYRRASKAEIAQYNKQPSQRYDRPIGTPFSSNPDDEEVSDDKDEAVSHDKDEKSTK